MIDFEQQLGQEPSLVRLDEVLDEKEFYAYLNHHLFRAAENLTSYSEDSSDEKEADQLDLFPEAQRLF